LSVGNERRNIVYLSEELQYRSFVEWNELVKGLVQVWDIAHLLGISSCLSQQLQNDQDGTLVEQLGQIGNDRARLFRVLMRCWQALAADIDLSYQEATHTDSERSALLDSVMQVLLPQSSHPGTPYCAGDAHAVCQHCADTAVHEDALSIP
jgi:hypothetical protein